MSTARGQQLADALRRVEDRIVAACADAGRDRSELTLIVVTKSFPGTDIEELAELGVQDIGESRDQEAGAKVAELDPDLRRGLRLHFIGQLQTNKAASVASYADAVHSVDRNKLVEALSRHALRAGRVLDVLVQVDLAGADRAPAAERGRRRGGAAPDEATALAAAVAADDGLRLRGIMAVAPLGADPAAAFAELGRVSRAVGAENPEATWVSAGMSQDLEQAVQAGATHLRVGRAILGYREPLR